MGIKTILSCVLLLVTTSSFADVTTMCNDRQQMKCTNFCKMHEGMKSCMLDQTTKSGTCTCVDGTMHSKNK